MIGRSKEIALMEELYYSRKFEMLLMHGRRRVGKTFLLSYFSSLHEENTVFFTGDKTPEKTNVQAFCKELNKVLHAGEYLLSLETWNDVYSFLKDRDFPERLVIIIDEFTYLYKSNPAYDSGLQNAIDKILRTKNIFLILCGSEVSVIEEIFDDSTKPLYGRKTASLKLEPFSYKEARQFFPKYSDEQAFTAYSIVGGIPLYLALFDDSVSVRKNIIRHCLSTTGYLFDEIETLLRMELKETHFYKSIMLAINAGATTFNEIKTKVDEDAAKVAKYINVLIHLGFIKKETPCGEKEKTRNTLYTIADNYFAFYFTFIHKHKNMLNGLISPEAYYDRELTKEKLSAYLGHRFEGICASYLREQFYAGKMPFFAEHLGRWWGTHPLLKRPEEIDLLALDAENALFAECKCTAEPFNEKQLADLEESSQCIDRPKKWFVIFSKNGVTDGVKKKIAENPAYRVVTLAGLFE